MIPSPQQVEIFDNLENGDGHTLIQARAGTGKTSTIVAGLSHIGRDEALLVAFNKSIATELKSRVSNPRVEISTLHSYGLRQITRALGRVEIDADKSRKIVKRWEQDKEIVNAVTTLASRAKGELATDPDELDDLLDRVGIEVPVAEGQDENQVRAKILDLTERLLATSRDEQGTIDFDDMIWYPNVFAMRLSTYERVFVDETQDLNASQLKLVLKASSNRICAVGDSFQAIYGFRGADSDAMGRLERKLDATVLGLTVTYRCPRKVVSLVKELVPDFEAAPDAPEGIVKTVTREQMLDGAREGDFVLSRANAPLLGVCFELLRRGRRANVSGRDVGSRLKGTIGRMRTENVTQLLQKVGAWRDKEIERLTKLDRPTELISDTAECIFVLAEGCSSVEEIRQKIDSLFSDNSRRGADHVLLDP